MYYLHNKAFCCCLCLFSGHF